MSCLQSNRKRRNDCILGVLKRCLQLLAYLHESNIAASANLLNHNENELKLPTPKTTPRSSDGNGSAAAVGSVGSDDITLCYLSMEVERPSVRFEVHPRLFLCFNLFRIIFCQIVI